MRLTKLTLLLLASLVGGLFAESSNAQEAATAKTPNESLLGEFVVTGVVQEKLPKIAVLPSLSPDFEDVILRGVVRRDLELTGLFDVLDDDKAPPGAYAFNDPVDIDAWKKLGAEAIVKVAAQKNRAGKINVVGLAYFLDVGRDPVYEKTLVIDPDEVRVTGHRITDALLGALTGRPGGFASRFAFAMNWGRNRRVVTMDADGHALTPVTPAEHTSISPAWGPDGALYYLQSQNFSPFMMMRQAGSNATHVPLAKRGSIYSLAFNKEHTRLAVAMGDGKGTSIFTASPNGQDMKSVSTTPLATHPVFSPSGKLAWIGGGEAGTQRLWVDGKAVSPPGFTAAAPTFCDTEDGIRMVYAVVVGKNQDLVMSNVDGKGIVRLTQNQGSNSYPACSSDGRMLAFFSTRNKDPGLYMMSLKRFTVRKVASQVGFGLRWDPLPPPRPETASTPAQAGSTNAPQGSQKAPGSVATSE